MSLFISWNSFLFIHSKMATRGQQMAIYNFNKPDYLVMDFTSQSLSCVHLCNIYICLFIIIYLLFTYLLIIYACFYPSGLFHIVTEP